MQSHSFVHATSSCTWAITSPSSYFTSIISLSDSLSDIIPHLSPVTQSAIKEQQSVHPIRTPGLHIPLGHNNDILMFFIATCIIYV